MGGGQVGEAGAVVAATRVHLRRALRVALARGLRLAVPAEPGCVPAKRTPDPSSETILSETVM